MLCNYGSKGRESDSKVRGARRHTPEDQKPPRMADEIGNNYGRINSEECPPSSNSSSLVQRSNQSFDSLRRVVYQRVQSLYKERFRESDSRLQNCQQ